MAITQNTFTGNGSNLGPFSFTFKWLEPTDIKVTVAGVLKTAGTHYNLQNLNYTTKNGGQVLFTAGNAPANGAAIVIYRQTDDTDLAATFYSGSAIRAQDLNSNFTQGLYVTQEANNNVVKANATANTALTNSNTAISTANSAVSTANTASSNASAAVATAVSTANTASSNASTALSTANTAISTANAAASAVANALLYDIIANVAAIPGSPVNNDAVEVTDSTGIESFTPLTGVPGGFVGNSGLSVRIVYTTTGNTWTWIQYFPNDPETRYLKTSGGTLTGQLKADDSTSVAAPVIAFDGDTNTGIAHTGADELALVTGGTARLTIDSSGTLDVTGAAVFDSTANIAGNLTVDTNTLFVDATNNRVGIGTTPVFDLDVAPAASSATFRIHARSNTTPVPAIELMRGTNTTFGADSYGDYRIKNDAGNLSFEYGDSGVTAERVRIDSSGRVGIGTTGAMAPLNVHTASSNTTFAITRGTVGAEYGYMMAGSDGSTTPGLRFFPVSNGVQGSEVARIDSSGTALISKTASAIGTAGTEIGNGAIWTTRDANTAIRVNRLTSDGTLVEFLQASVAEGTISVSGTTVSYNGAHLSRWSQLPSGQKRTEILRGSVLSNIDEMCEWGDEENEQLNRMKVSDIEGDKNVSGVFQAWDDDDDTYTNDFYCAMTGDFIIRIAAGVAVERGDLLMSAGDGTAKPQDDDIIRSKTIAKVTSNNVSCTYADGSYCVPCVLMAC